MNYFAPGLRELARVSCRSIWRLQLMLQRRKLLHLESRLGLLGWQQADYDHGTQQHVDRLTDYERSQVELTNQSATLGLEIAKMEEQRSFERKIFEEKRTHAAANCERLAGPLKEGEEALTKHRQDIVDFKSRIAALVKEEGIVEESYRAMLARGENAKQPEVIRAQKRVIAIPRERQGCEEQLAAALAPMATLENEVEQRRAMLSVETEALRAMEKSFAQSDEGLSKEIAGRKREKQKLERQIEALEKAKSQPYREIGRALADHHIEPANQPDALKAVLEQRNRLGVCEGKLAESLAQSAGENRMYVWLGWFVFLLVIALVAEGGWLWLRRQ